MDARLTQGEREVNDVQDRSYPQECLVPPDLRRTMNSGGSCGDGTVNTRGATYTARMNAAAIAGGAGVGLIVGVMVGRWTIRREVRMVQAEHGRAEEGSEERIRESVRAREVRDQILGTMHDGVLLLDRDSRTVFANAALEHHLGARPGRSPRSTHRVSARRSDGRRIRVAWRSRRSKRGRPPGGSA